ncbi:MAG: starvation-sensing protein RspA [Candidatus Solibacter sp.]|nr:starvation-sensing protein RspA [Candidatus Solibacter sp.]
MYRRSLLRAVAPALCGAWASRAQQALDRTSRGMRAPTIREVRAIPINIGARLVVVKITTNQDGLYGYGCATFTQRSDLILPAVERYLAPFLAGKPVDRIEDTWQSCYNSSYWRNGPVLNNAISGVDEALWDIKGRMAGLPVYQLLGGKCREAAAAYTSTGGNEIPQVMDQARRLMDRGFRHVRVQIGIPGMSAYGGGGGGARTPALHNRPVFEPKPYLLRTLKMIEEVRKQLGDEVELLHDMHERVPPRDAIQFGKDVERFKLFYLEDPFSPEDIAYFRQFREQCATPVAMGELFNSPHEWTPLITERLIDYIRVHVSQAGGITPARKIAVLGEAFGVKTAWHGPDDCSPVGHAAQLHLDLASPNFGIQEGDAHSQRVSEVFRGCPTFRDGYLWANDSPGWGIDVDEKLAARYPFREGGLNGGWSDIRRLDGTVIKQ